MNSGCENDYQRDRAAQGARQVGTARTQRREDDDFCRHRIRVLLFTELLSECARAVPSESLQATRRVSSQRREQHSHRLQLVYLVHFLHKIF